MSLLVGSVQVRLALLGDWDLVLKNPVDGLIGDLGGDWDNLSKIGSLLLGLTIGLSVFKKEAPEPYP
jgi:hypothetical protein